MCVCARARCRNRKRVDPSAFLLRKGTAYINHHRGGTRGVEDKETAGPGGEEMVQVAVTRV